jgi:hypothetical protein
MKISLLSLSFLLALAVSNSAHACSFLGQSSVCESSARADAIFVGTVHKVEQLKAKNDDLQREQIVGQIAHIRVEDVFKGKIGPKIAIHSRMTIRGERPPLSAETASLRATDAHLGRRRIPEIGPGEGGRQHRNQRRQIEDYRQTTDR